MRYHPAHYYRRASSLLMRRLYGTISHVETTENVVALTFDDGPHPEYTRRLLDMLDRYNAKATLFMIGREALRYPEIVRDAAVGGHCVANHTFSHPPMPSISSSARIAELRSCEAALLGYTSRLFRPPKGLQTLASYKETKQIGLEPITWNAHAEDWEERDAYTTASMLTHRVRNGSIVLLHDRLDDPGSWRLRDRTEMLRGLELFIKENRNRFQFVTVPEILRRGKPFRANWFIPSEARWAQASAYF